MFSFTCKGRDYLRKNNQIGPSLTLFLAFFKENGSFFSLFTTDNAANMCDFPYLCSLNFEETA